MKIALAQHGSLDGTVASPAVRRGDLLFIGGQVALDERGELVAPGDVRGQTSVVLDTIESILRATGGALADVVDIRTFLADPRDALVVQEIAAERFRDSPPAWTSLGYVGTRTPGALVMMRVIANLGDGEKQSVARAGFAGAQSPFAAACAKGGLVHVAGQSAADDQGRIATPLDHCRQARAAYDRMLELVQSLGGGVDDILDFTSFHHDIRGAIPTLEQIYIPQIMGADAYCDDSATTSHIGATGLVAPDVLGVYTATADLTPGARTGSTPDSIWWKGKYPIAGAARKPDGRLVSVAGQVASAPDGSIMHPGDVEQQARYIFCELSDALKGLGLTMADVAEVSSFHKDVRVWDTVMAVAGEFFEPNDGPAWTFVACPGMWFEGFLHEIAAIAVVPDESSNIEED